MVGLCFRFIVITIGFASVLATLPSFAEDQVPSKPRAKRLLLLGQRADTHPRTTHEYMAGVRLVARMLQDRGNIQVIIVQADSPWEEGPELLNGADGVFVYLTEGAKWICDDARRLAAFQQLSRRGGGISGLHWGLGTREAVSIEPFVSLFGGCHGGPDRKFKVGEFRLEPSPERHPITAGIAPFSVRDELYFALKFPESRQGLIPLLHARGSGVDDVVAWAWERPGSGRSFGFTGLHYHENWNQLEYRRLIVQGILWTLQEQLPANGLSLEINQSDLALPDQSPVNSKP